MKRLQSLMFMALGSFLAFSAGGSNLSEKTELQWALCEKDFSEVLLKMNWAEESHSTYQTYFFDSRHFNLLSTGTFLRVEQKGNKRISKVKIEFSQLSQEDLNWLHDHQSTCEKDRYGEKEKLRCAITAKAHENGALWSTDQQAMLNRFRPTWRNYDLFSWGPYSIEKVRISQNLGLELSLEEALVAENLPRVLELSARVSSSQAKLTYSELTETLQNHGVKICTLQRGKFERILEILGQR